MVKSPTQRAADKKELFANYWSVIVAPSDLLNYETEYNFDAPRKHRFDFAWPGQKIAVEVDGNAWHVRGGGRHGTDIDKEKMNIAAELGWRIFHFSPRMITANPDACIEQVRGAVLRAAEL